MCGEPIKAMIAITEVPEESMNYLVLEKQQKTDFWVKESFSENLRRWVCKK